MGKVAALRIAKEGEVGGIEAVVVVESGVATPEVGETASEELAAVTKAVADDADEDPATVDGELDPANRGRGEKMGTGIRERGGDMGMNCS